MSRIGLTFHSRLQRCVLVAAPKSNGAGRMCRRLEGAKCSCSVRSVLAGTCSLNRHLVRRNLGILGEGNPFGPGGHRVRPGCARSVPGRLFFKVRF